MDTGSRSKFFVHLAGTTHDAHRPIVNRFVLEGQTEVKSPEQCDYLLVFCPVVSRVGTDIREALDHIPVGKPAVLVVMHHSFNPNQVVGESSRQVQNPKVLLTVDCLFYEGILVSSKLNDQMWREVYEFLGVYQVSLWQSSWRRLKKNWKLVSIVSFILAVYRFGFWGGRFFNQKELE